MKDADIAKDCLQDTLIQVLKNIDKYTHQGRFEAWLSTVSVRICLNQLKSKHRKPFDEISDIDEPFVAADAEYKLEKQDVMKFVNSLPEKYRIVINMYLAEGYSHKEIAEYMGITESSSRSLLTRARKMINEAFTKENMTVVHRGIKKKLAQSL